MTTWIGVTKDGRFAIELREYALQALERYCSEGGCFETGGILIGCYSDDLSLAIVHEATPPPCDSKGDRSWFVRGVRGLRELLTDRWRAKHRTFYVGEWHFHPTSRVEPSSDDFAQMLEISRVREYNCKEPLLLILATGEHEGRRIFRVFVCPDEHAPLEFRSVEAWQGMAVEVADGS